MNIYFLTLLVGLVTGAQDVELSVGPNVAAIELKLDGAAISHLASPPWKARVDFGANLRPHRLDALAFDADGVQLGQATQYVNLPRPGQQAALGLVEDERGRPRALRVSWASVGDAKPKSIEVEVDGVALDATDPNRVRLPSLHERDVHVARARVRFSDSIVAKTELVFGGSNVMSSDVELTAIPLALASTATPDPGALRGIVEVGGQPVELRALEAGPVNLVIVRDETLDVLPPAWAQRLAFLRKSTALNGLPNGSQVRVLDPHPVTPNRARPRERVFDVSRPLPTASTSVVDVLLATPPADPARGAQALGEAVAVAAQIAAQDDRPRAVVLVMDRVGPDASVYPVEEVRRYLSRLAVPLVVWSFRGAPGDWGATTKLSSDDDLREAWLHLLGELGRQRIAWVAGSHLPEAFGIRASAKAKEVRIAGR